jgi:hypothetical protein
MRCIKIITRANAVYRYAAVDQQTGDIPLQLSDRPALVALCQRLGWTIQGEKSSVENSAGVDKRKQRRWGRVRARVGGATKFISPRKRAPHAPRAAEQQ